MNEGLCQGKVTEQRSLGALVWAEVITVKLLLTGTADTGDPGLPQWGTDTWVLDGCQ